ncbi:hypothetical protein D3C71_711510 [compost metagenome]
MKNKIPALTFYLFLCLKTCAQTTLTGEDLNPLQGQMSVVYQCPIVNPGTSGANQTWDLSGLTPTATITRSYTSSTIPGATIRQNKNTNGAATSIDLKCDSTGQEIITQSNETTVVIGYYNPKKTLALPAVYSISHQDYYHASASGTPVYGELVEVVDGYGTLITPEGTFSNVVRVHLHDNFYIETNLETRYYTEDTYTWYKAGIKDELASTTSIAEVGQAPYYESALYLETTSSGLTEEEMGRLAVYPTPVVSNFNIQPSEAGVKSITITNVQGKLFTCSYKELANSIIVNSEQLSSGVYFVRLTYASGKAEQATIVKE